MLHVCFSVCYDADAVLALGCMLRGECQLLLMLPTLSGKSPCFQEDPEWTAEKELCQRKGIPYQAPKKGSKVMPLIICTTTNAVLESTPALMLTESS